MKSHLVAVRIAIKPVLMSSCNFSKKTKKDTRATIKIKLIPFILGTKK